MDALFYGAIAASHKFFFLLLGVQPLFKKQFWLTGDFCIFPRSSLLTPRSSLLAPAFGIFPRSSLLAPL
jgi:hypothetical protein